MTILDENEKESHKHRNIYKLAGESATIEQLINAHAEESAERIYNRLKAAGIEIKTEEGKQLINTTSKIMAETIFMDSLEKFAKEMFFGRSPF